MVQEERQEVVAERKEVVVVRYPNLETFVFLAIISLYKIVREKLNLVDDFEIHWVPAGEEAPGDVKGRPHLNFNVGGGPFDQHGDPRNREINQVCSLDLVEEVVGFTALPWLQPVYERVRRNDLQGERVSNSPKNLREILKLWEITLGEERRGVHQQDDSVDELVDNLIISIFGMTPTDEFVSSGLELTKILLRYLHHLWLQKRKPEEEPFHWKNIKAALEWAESETEEAEKIQHLRERIKEAFDFKEEEQQWAREELQRAQVIYIRHPQLPRPLKVALVDEARSYELGPVSRSKEFNIDVIIIKRHSVERCHQGVAQIFSRDLHFGGKQFRLDLAPVAGLLRYREAGHKGVPSQKEKQQWERPGRVIVPQARRIKALVVRGQRQELFSPVVIRGESPWFFPEFRAAIFNGTRGNPEDIVPTQLSGQEIFNLVAEALPFCPLMYRDEKGLFRPLPQRQRQQARKKQPRQKQQRKNKNKK